MLYALFKASLRRGAKVRARLKINPLAVGAHLAVKRKIESGEKGDDRVYFRKRYRGTLSHQSKT